MSLRSIYMTNFNETGAAVCKARQTDRDYFLIYNTNLDFHSQKEKAKLGI